MVSPDGNALVISVEVVYALPHHQEVVGLQLPAGSTLQQALEASGLLQKYPEIDPERNKLGIFGKIAKADAVLRDRDRIEVYRPLLADPKEARRKRAADSRPSRNR